MRTTYLLVLIGFNVFWGGTYSAFKDLKHWLNPGQLVTLRYGLAAILLLASWPFLRGPAPRGRDLWKTLVMGLIVFVGAPRLQVVATQAGQAGDMSVLVALEPLVATVGAALFLHEHVPARRWFGFFFGVLGAILLSNIWRPDFHLASLGANLLFISSFFCEAAYSVMGKPLIERAAFLKVTTLALLGGTLVNFAWDGPSTLAAARTLPLHAWLEIAYLAILCTAIGYAVWFAALRVVPVNVVAMTVFVQPFAGTLIAIVLLGESAHWGQLWGGLAIALGLALGLRQNRKPTPAAAP
ncbi:MAG TPA: DMT family transporter [Verrucomicrobiae bacterium]|nr:DMT family transporter [Verrucomicrobiae bacterium]